VLLNHDPASRLEARVELGGCGRVSATRAFAYGGGEGGFRPAEVAAAGAAGEVEVDTPAYAITVLDLTLAR
jgi:hypothetical protein